MKKKSNSYDIFEKSNTVASATECTGLMQTPPTNQEESEAYSDIYNVPDQVNNMADLEPEDKNN